MRKSLLSISGTFLIAVSISLCLCIHLYATEDKLPTAEKIIEKSLKAAGGRKAHEKIQNRMAELKVITVADGMEYKSVIYIERGNKNYVHTDLGTMGEMESGSDGNVAWEISPFTGTRILEGEELTAHSFDMALDGSVTWKTLCESIETEGVEGVHGIACYKVVFTPKEGSPRAVYYDKESFLVIKVAMKLKDLDKMVPIEVLLTDYKQVDDILMPYHISVSSMGQVIQRNTVERIEHNTEMPEGIFDLPGKVQKLLAEKNEI